MKLAGVFLAGVVVVLYFSFCFGAPLDFEPFVTSGQVWSLTQFSPLDFSQSRIGVKNAFSTNAQSRFASVDVDGVLGPPRQHN